ncbi:MAG TPA: alpha/beta fold hydrolase [Pseudonocardia sp.]|uniref:alpha/beta fold hydrolase n=1 Tax=Pseudonocardia sp. TaxID=60912 RepID=UPI002EDB84A9
MSRRGLLLAAGAAGVAAGTAGVLAARARRRAHDAVDGAVDGAIVSAERISEDTAGHRGGSGTPILLLHGISVTWRTWKPILPLLEPHHDVIAPTLLGHSGAAPLADGMAPSLEALVDGVLAELDTLGLDRVHVVGNSLGGWIALELARRGRARSVVAFSPAGAWHSTARMAVLGTGMRVGMDLMDGLGDQLERLARSPRGRRLLLSNLVAHPERYDPDELVADIRAIRHAPVVRPLLRVIADRPLQPLPDPGCPVRVVWGRKDRVIPFRHYGEPLLERLPTAELITLDDVGHVPMSDDPDTVARLILEVTDAVDRDGVPATGS